MSIHEDYIEAQLARTELAALEGAAMDAGIRLIEVATRYLTDVNAAAEVRAARPTRRRNGRRRPPGHLSRQILDQVDQVGELLEKAVAATNELRGGNT